MARRIVLSPIAAVEGTALGVAAYRSRDTKSPG
jgi:hypothetical protein